MPEGEGTAIEVGRVAFDAYGEAAGWKTYDGRPMPKWEDVGERVRSLWNVAASRVAGQTHERTAQRCIAIVLDAVGWSTVRGDSIRRGLIREIAKDVARKLLQRELDATDVDKLEAEARARW